MKKSHPRKLEKDDCLQMDGQGGSLGPPSKLRFFATSSHQSGRCFAACRRQGFIRTSSDLYLFILNFYFVLGYSRLISNIVIVSGDQ